MKFKTYNPEIKRKRFTSERYNTYIDIFKWDNKIGFNFDKNFNIEIDLNSKNDYSISFFNVNDNDRIERSVLIAKYLCSVKDKFKKYSDGCLRFNICTL